MHENLPNGFFLQKEVIGFALLNNLREVTSSAVFHDDVDGSILFVNNFVMVSDNIIMLKLSQDIYFINQLLFLSFLHNAIVYFLPYHLLAWWHMLYQADFSKTSYDF